MDKKGHMKECGYIDVGSVDVEIKLQQNKA